MKSHLTLKALLLISLLLALASCEHKDLCIHHEAHIARCSLYINVSYDLSVDADYLGRTDSILFPTEPEGLRLMVYDQNDNPNLYNLPRYGSKVILPEGNNSLLFYNNDTEYIVFNNLDSPIAVRATTRETSRASYLGNSYSREAEKTMNQPDMLFGTYIYEFQSKLSLTNDTINVTMHPLVYSYIVYFNISKGFNSIAYSRGALAGMASSVFIDTGITSDDTATVLFDCDQIDGHIEGILRSFGTPETPAAYTRSDHTYALNLELRLVDGSTLSLDYDVSDQVAKLPHGGVIIVNDIEIPEVENNGSAAPFDVDVIGWGEYQEIPMI